MQELYKTNKIALDYALSSISKMKHISEPIRKYLGINSFGYMRTYSDCRYLSLLDGHENYTKKFFEIIPKSDPHFIEAIQNTPEGEAHFSLWPTSPKVLTPILSLLDAYDLWHGFQITYRKEDYCEMFSFTFSKESDDRSFFYMKNIPYLLKFITFFRAQAADLIDCKKADLAVFPEKFDIRSIDNIDLQQFLLDLDKNLTLKNLDGNTVQLTHRESECLQLLVQSKTCKEVARVFGISPRTVELHVQNIKQKLGISYKGQLIDIYKNSFY